MRFNEDELFVVNRSADDEFDDVGERDVDGSFRLRRDDARAGCSVLIDCGERRLAIDGRPRLAFTGESHAEHCHEPSGIASRPTQYV